MTYTECKELAYMVRGKCYEYAMSEKSQGYDYHRHEGLSCMCGVASMALYEASGGRMRVMHGKFNGNDHCWNEWGRWRFDLTATQFRIDDLVLITLRNRVSGEGWEYSRGNVMGWEDFRWERLQNPTKLIIGEVLR